MNPLVSSLLPPSVPPIVPLALGAFALMNLLFIVVMFLVWMERKVAGHIQARMGPMEVGYHGALQLVADAIKTMAKQDIIPKHADALLFRLAPILIIVPALTALSLIPFGRGLQFADLNIGLVLFLALTSLTSMVLLMAGWSSNNKYSLLGAMRSAAQDLSYEVALIFSTIGVVLVSGTLSLRGIVDAQSPVWNIVTQPLGFVLFFIAMVAELNRTPFDLPEAESEIVAGYFTEYSGMRFILFFLGEYVNMLVLSGLLTVLFLGGWHGVLLPGVVWFVLKVMLVVFVLMWMRWTFPRFRMDQLMGFGWKVLIPLSLLNILLTGLGVMLFG